MTKAALTNCRVKKLEAANKWLLKQLRSEVIDKHEGCTYFVEYMKDIKHYGEVNTVGVSTTCKHCGGGGCCRCNDTGIEI